jgi:hypothetical protein
MPICLSGPSDVQPFVGKIGTLGFADGIGTNALFHYPYGIACLSNGSASFNFHYVFCVLNVYVCMYVCNVCMFYRFIVWLLWLIHHPHIDDSCFCYETFIQLTFLCPNPPSIRFLPFTLSPFLVSLLSQTHILSLSLHTYTHTLFLSLSLAFLSSHAHTPRLNRLQVAVW